MRIIILILISVSLIAVSAATLDSAVVTGGPGESVKYETEAAGGAVFSAASGEKVGEISIPALGLRCAPLYYLPTRENLKKGVCMDGPEGGWQIVGAKGRSMISAHNDKAFKSLDKINAGDMIFVSVGYGDFTFRAEGTYIYRRKSDDWKTVAFEDTKEYGLVLVTCYPLNKRNTTGDRLIIRCGPVY